LSESCPIKAATYRNLRFSRVAALVPSAGTITAPNRIK
jgi:hypothetical protein